jgi:hypothetical protein
MPDPGQKNKKVYSSPVIVLAIALFFLSLWIPYNFFGNPLHQTMTDIYNITLTATIIFFTTIQVALLNLQYQMERQKNQIEDLRNTMEKGLGPIYSIMNYSPIVTLGFKTKDGKIDEEALKRDVEDYKIISIEEKKTIAEILSKYPHMFTEEILNSWKDINRGGIIIEDNHRDDMKEIPRIPIKFKNLINEEYKKTLSEYNKLLKK